MTDYQNREDKPCEEDEHKFPPEFYELWAEDSSAKDWCCIHCGWSHGDIEALKQPPNDPPEDNLTDAEADAQVLAYAGFGTDEDYGLFDYGGEG